MEDWREFLLKFYGINYNDTQENLNSNNKVNYIDMSKPDSEYLAKIKEIKVLIDKALDNKDKELFNKLTKKYNLMLAEL